MVKSLSIFPSSSRVSCALATTASLALAACDGAAEAPPDDTPACLVDRDCHDGDLCNGAERCASGRCEAGLAVTCRDPGDTCLATGECGQLPVVVPACDAPRAPVLPALPAGVVLPFDRPVEAGTSADPGAAAPLGWVPAEALTLDASGSVTVFARAAGGPDDAAGCIFRATYHVVDALPASVDDATSDAVAVDDPRIVGWAAGWVEPVAWGADNDADVQDPRRAIGPAGADALDVTSLGNGGVMTLVLPWAIGDGAGPELAVFENGFSDQFLELAFVEVSSDGEHFARFDALALDMEPVAAYGTLDASRVAGLAGRYQVGFGTPFDLASLAYHPEVRAGRVDLAAITHVRIVDIVGDGGARDSFGAPIYDPTPTYGTAGFDLDGIAVLTR